jgi:hypothetical protein
VSCRGPGHVFDTAFHTGLQCSMRRQLFPNSTVVVLQLYWALKKHWVLDIVNVRRRQMEVRSCTLCGAHSWCGTVGYPAKWQPTIFYSSLKQGLSRLYDSLCPVRLLPGQSPPARLPSASRSLTCPIFAGRLLHDNDVRCIGALAATPGHSYTVAGRSFLAQEATLYIATGHIGSVEVVSTGCGVIHMHIVSLMDAPTRG